MSPSPEPGRPPEAVDPAVLDSLRALAGDDREFLPGLVREFLRHAERALARLRRAAGDGDAATLKDAAHGLKGSAGSLGARHLATLCAEVETRARAGELADAKALVEGIAREEERVRARLAPLVAGPDAPRGAP